jgi:hypothetical protein
MPRTTGDLVRGIIDTDVTVILDPFIKVANTLVNKICAPSYNDDELLKDIETWLAAHAYTIYEPRSIQISVGSVQESVESKVGLGLQGSKYGQMAMRLDYLGLLASWDNRINEAKTPKPTITWLGTDCT